jgi:5-hydroxyisourate hydrolase-like protein (transthyretin family)
MKQFLLFLFVLCICPVLTSAQGTLPVNGIVIDAETGRPLEGVRVTVNIEKLRPVDTNDDGEFHLDVPKELTGENGSFYITFHLDGYEVLKKYVSLPLKGEDAFFELVPKKQQQEEQQKMKKQQQKGFTVQTFDMETKQVVPGVRVQRPGHRPVITNESGYAFIEVDIHTTRYEPINLTYKLKYRYQDHTETVYLKDIEEVHKVYLDPLDMSLQDLIDEFNTKKEEYFALPEDASDKEDSKLGNDLKRLYRMIRDKEDLSESQKVDRSRFIQDKAVVQLIMFLEKERPRAARLFKNAERYKEQYDQKYQQLISQRPLNVCEVPAKVDELVDIKAQLINTKSRLNAMGYDLETTVAKDSAAIGQLIQWEIQVLKQHQSKIRFSKCEEVFKASIKKNSDLLKNILTPRP